MKTMHETVNVTVSASTSSRAILVAHLIYELLRKEGFDTSVITSEFDQNASYSAYDYVKNPRPHKLQSIKETNRIIIRDQTEHDNT